MLHYRIKIDQIKAFRTTKSIIAFRPLKKSMLLTLSLSRFFFFTFSHSCSMLLSINPLAVCAFLIMTIDSAFFLYDKRRTTLCCQLKKEEKKKPLFGVSSRLSEEQEG